VATVIGESIYYMSIFRLVLKLLSAAAQGIGYISDSIKVKVNGTTSVARQQILNKQE
jgi:hypothetical protein